MRRISPTTFRIARRGTSREINRQIALNLVRSRQPISRADLARLMGIRRGAISRLVEDLIRTKQIFEGGRFDDAVDAGVNAKAKDGDGNGRPESRKGTAKRGRRPRHLYIETRRHCALAVDISAARTLLQVTDPLGEPLLDIEELPAQRHPDGLVRELGRNIQRFLTKHPEVGDCLGVGVTIAGLVDPERGRLRYAPTLGWRELDIREPLEALIKLPVVVENSVKACVLALVWATRGHAPVDGPVAFVNASDGVGVGIAIDGQLLRGAHNFAGEFGHIAISMDGPRCACGRKGCWEAYVSVRATVSRYLGRDLSWPESGEPAKVTVGNIVAQARTGEARALQTLRETGYYLGRGLSNIVKAIEPRRIYMSGEITEAWDLILPSVQQAMREEAMLPELGACEILTVPLGDHPRLRGAAALVTSPAFAAPVVA
jgi:N-acetylglucosamine repressor